MYSFGVDFPRFWVIAPPHTMIERGGGIEQAYLYCTMRGS